MESPNPHCRIGKITVYERKPEDWLIDPAYSDIMIIDPDGWDRQNFEESWARPINQKEFERRLGMCTIDMARRTQHDSQT